MENVLQNINIQEKFKIWVAKVHKLLNTNFDRAFGLDISDKSIEIAELSKLFRFSIENHGRIELPEGIINDGHILDEKALAVQIKTLLQQVKPRKVSTNKVVLSLPESQVFTHHFVLNTMLKGDALRLSVQKEIMKILPISPQRMYWDIKVKSMSDGSNSIVFMGILKEIAESYVRVCNSVGLSVVAFGLEPLSVARLLLEQGRAVTAIVDMGTHTTNVSIIEGNDELAMTITIPVGGRNMSQAIAQGLNIDEAEAEAKKVEVGSGTSEELFFLIEPSIKEIATGVKRAIGYYEETFKEKVGSLLLVGGACVMGGIKEKIGEIVGKPVVSVLHFNNFETLGILGAKKNNDVVPMLYTSVIGLAMLGASNEFEDVNLLKQISGAGMNSINRSELFNAGYLSKVTAVRIFLNSRLMLAVSLLLCVGSIATFGYFWFSYKASQAYQVKVYRTANIAADVLTKDLGKLFNAGNTASSTVASSTASSTNKAKK